jgi:hypothetical protein
MKNQILFSFFFLFGIINLHGQSLSFGVHAISVYSTFKKSEMLFLGGNLFEYKWGYGFGGNVTKKIGDHFDLRAELNYERKGAKYDILYTDENGNLVSGKKPVKNLDYLSLPILLQLKFGEKNGFYFQTGTSIQYLVNHSLALDLDDESKGLYESLEKEGKYNKFDQSVIFGLGGYTTLKNNMEIYLNGRFNYGLNNPTYDTSVFFTDKNIALMLLAGVQF